MLTAGGLLVVAVIFGGGGSGAGLANLVIQLAAIAALALNRGAFVDFFARAPREFAVLVGITLLLPLLQCIPLPPAIWHELPGRDLASQSLALVGRQEAWMPLSLNVRRTAIAFLALLPPLAILTLTWRATDDDHRALLILLVACGVLEVVLGTQQLAFGNRHFMMHAEAFGSQDLQGTFANRNSAGLFLDIALCALVGLLGRPRHSVASLGFGGGIAVVLAVGLFLTRSRSSMALFLVPLTMLLAFLWSMRGKIAATRSRVLALAGVAVVLTALATGLFFNERVQHSLSRFDTLQDARPAIWQDAQSSISRFWPVGSGIGSFDEVFQIDESLENISPGRAARAHNEYLETMVESGVVAPALIMGWVVAILLAVWSSARNATGRGVTAAGSAFCTLLAFQSVLDYPLRSQTVLCVAGLALALLTARRSVAASGK